MKIGVLAVQGDFQAHAEVLARLGAEPVLVKHAGQVPEVEGLILPGGESTTFLKFLWPEPAQGAGRQHPGWRSRPAGPRLLPASASALVWREEGLSAAIQEAAAEGKPLFGTCAGAILLARKVEGPEQPSLGLLDITVRRNAYGRQVASFVARGKFQASEQDNGDTHADLEMVFIRAPVISELGPDVEVLARCPSSDEGAPVFVRQGRVLASTFHPELTQDTRVHQYFLDLIKSNPRITRIRKLLLSVEST